MIDVGVKIPLTSHMSFAAQAPPCNVYAMSQSDTAKQYTYRRRQPEETVLYKTVAAHVRTFIADRETEGHPVDEDVATVVERIRQNRAEGYIRYPLRVGYHRTCQRLLGALF